MTFSSRITEAAPDGVDYVAAAHRHLWRHFAPMAAADQEDLKLIVRGEGSYLVDAGGRRYLDGLSNLYCVNVGYSYGEEIGQAALEQYRELGYHSSWATTHPRAVELAQRIAELAPGDLNHVFPTTSGGDSVETAWKIARQYHLLRGENRWKAISRHMAYHGTSLGALSLMGIPGSRSQFEPLLAGVVHARNTRRIGRPDAETEDEFTVFLLDDLEQRIISEDPATVAMIMVEPVQNSGGALTPPRGYAEGVRALADKYGILLVADETVTAFGRMGEWFATARYDFRPDLVTMAKGLSSAHAVIGAVAATDQVFEPFTRAGVTFKHGNTFGGHPVMTAVALKNLEIMERLKLPGRVRDLEGALEKALRSLEDLDVVVEVRGAGYLWAIELAATRPDGSALTAAELDRLYGTKALAAPLQDRGVMLRVSLDPGYPVISVAPPLVAGEAEFVLLTDALRDVLTIVDRDRSAGKK
ncbi:aminotransferase class III-fold pyridoxal phosphate-dependent enzyme [Amycolatopsis saalfeldensis]|uniref:Adenosylmethionine-8-amino-7-oxononanoate aminotransferase n=1 Tax=Amycolatopsis saalfeldensis TaxID=394193 RepID=A0A1H8XY67_9PSEU|nr:aminotransferase class III-fold pyridoxal phosphate-dependent enzyme [Amycolatopsis saalfeldensis]SEP44702.1 Adenosylmethionine-8-amino-7-oxononanoate aminotransferase [Amycolatopsis saalfeldensis]